MYLLGHEELHAAATRYLGEARLTGYRQRLHASSDGYRNGGLARSGRGDDSSHRHLLPREERLDDLPERLGELVLIGRAQRLHAGQPENGDAE